MAILACPSRALLLTAVGLFLQTSGRHLYFVTSSLKSKVSTLRALDLDGSGWPWPFPRYPHEDLLSYQLGPYNPGGGATGMCRMGDFLHWGDQTTATVHRVRLVDGKATEHDPSYMSHLNDPQGLHCDGKTSRVYVVDNSFGAAAVLFRTGDMPVQALNITTRGFGQIRGLASVGDNLWLAGDSGVFRTEETGSGAGNVCLKMVLNGSIFEAIVADTTGQSPVLFASTYDWSGQGVLTGELDASLKNVQGLRPMRGTACRRGTDIPWGLALDHRKRELYWILNDDEDNMQIMMESYGSLNQTSQAIYKGSNHAGYDLILDQTPAESAALLV